MPFDGTGLAEVEVTTLLVTARGLVVEGWCQDSLMRDGRVCTLGAVYQAYAHLALADAGLVPKALSRLARAIYGSDDPAGIVPWNDAANPDGSPACTKEDVLAAYDRAIMSAAL